MFVQWYSEMHLSAKDREFLTPEGFNKYFRQVLRELSYVVHDVAFIFFFAMIIGHVYLGTAAEPGTFGSMVRGRVTKDWARLHHPKWYREVTGNSRGR